MTEFEKNLRSAETAYVDLENSKGNFNSTLADIRCGVKSNIPFCCILFFCTFWKLLYTLVNFKIVKKFLYCYPKEREYIPCFFCLLTNRKRTLYICGNNCKCFR